MGGTRSKKKPIQTVHKGPRTVIVLFCQELPNSESPDTSYRRSFLRPKLILRWIAIVESLVLLAVLVTSLLDRLPH